MILLYRLMVKSDLIIGQNSANLSAGYGRFVTKV